MVPFSYKLMHHLKPFAIVVLNGEVTVYSVDSQMVLNGRSANTKPCLDTSNGGESMDPLKPFEWI